MSLVLVTPNPVSDKLNISTAEGVSILSVQLQDELGRLIYHTNATSLDVSNVASGIYHVVVVTDRGVVHKTITKQ